MTFIYFLRYDLKVIQTALMDTYLLYKKDNRLFLSNFATAILTLGSLRLIGGKDAMLNEVLVTISGFIGVIGATLFIFLFNLVITPAKLYKEADSEAKLFTWKDIEIREFSFGDYSDLGVGLEFINHKPKYFFDNRLDYVLISSISPKLIWLRKNDKEEDLSTYNSRNIPMLQGDTTYMVSGSIYPHEVLVMNHRARNVLSIAKWDDTGAWIEFSNEERINLEEGKSYTVRIEIRDAKISISADSMLFCGITCELLYKSDERNHKRVFIKLKDRYPKYEN